MNNIKNNESGAGEKEDLTGRNRIVRNVITSWGSYMVFVVAGFVMPRLIDTNIGQASLGVWDFCWSVVAYLDFAGLGVGNSVNRYVAKYRAVNDVKALGVTVSSVIVIQILIAIMVVLITIGLVSFVPDYFLEKFGEDVGDVSWVIGFLGLSVVFRMLFDPSRGVLAGCHRWDIYNGIQSASHVVSTIAMIITLLLGGGLAGMALAYMVVILLTEITRSIWAIKICKELVIKFEYIQKHQMKKMIIFGVKTIISGAPNMLVTQATVILLVSSLGPAALAVFARPLALVRHIGAFIAKFAFVLTPTAGSLYGTGKEKELREFFVLTVRYGVAFTLPMILFLAIYGDVILELWMGKNYVQWNLVIVLAAGYFLPVAQSPALRILMGMNKHGKIAVHSLFVMIAVYIAGLVIINITGWNLVSAAVLLVTPLVIGQGLMLPVYACKIFGITILSYLRSVFLLPVLCCLVYALILVLIRYFFQENLLFGMVFGLLAGGIVILALYWTYLLTEDTRKKLRTKFRLKKTEK